MPNAHLWGGLCPRPPFGVLYPGHQRTTHQTMVVVEKHCTLLLVVVWLKANHLTAKIYFCCSPSNHLTTLKFSRITNLRFFAPRTQRPPSNVHGPSLRLRRFEASRRHCPTPEAASEGLSSQKTPAKRNVFFAVLGMFFSFFVLFIFAGGLQKTIFFATIPRVEMYFRRSNWCLFSDVGTSLLDAAIKEGNQKETKRKPNNGAILKGGTSLLEVVVRRKPKENTFAPILFGGGQVNWLHSCPSQGRRGSPLFSEAR